ncbi:MAG TPA: hypothetical protein VNL77_19835 [Roseiflexaceae bacterium]|nr:hypothetical protein [Roseiflexaceae bacterium]
MYADEPSRGDRLSAGLRTLILLTAAIDLAIGLAFLFGPELSITLWPTPIPPALMRFIGAIILGNGVGAVVLARQGTWEGARVLFTVAIVYGVAVLVTLLYDLLARGANPLFWIYIALDAVFLAPIIAIFVSHERRRGARGRSAPVAAQAGR